MVQQMSGALLRGNRRLDFGHLPCGPQHGLDLAGGAHHLKNIDIVDRHIRALQIRKARWQATQISTPRASMSGQFDTQEYGLTDLVARIRAAIREELNVSSRGMPLRAWDISRAGAVLHMTLDSRRQELLHCRRLTVNNIVLPVNQMVYGRRVRLA